MIDALSVSISVDKAPVHADGDVTWQSAAASPTGVPVLKNTSCQVRHEHENALVLVSFPPFPLLKASLDVLGTRYQMWRSAWAAKC